MKGFFFFQKKRKQNKKKTRSGKIFFCKHKVFIYCTKSLPRRRGGKLRRRARNREDDSLLFLSYLPLLRTLLQGPTFYFYDVCCYISVRKNC